MFLVAVSRTPVDANPFVKLKLETDKAKMGSFHVFFAFDGKFSTFLKQNSNLVVTESIIKIEKEAIEDVLTFKTEKLAENLVLSIVSANLENNEICACRPFLGKTLYCHLADDENSVYFSTHIRLLKEAGVKIREDKKAVAEYFFFGNILGSSTLYENITKIMRGQKLRVSCRDDRLSLTSENFSVPVKKEADPDESKTAKDIIKMLKSSLAKLKPMEGKIALLFSGGLDSSVLAKLLKDEIGNANAYSMNYPFENPKESHEIRYAVTAGKALQLDHSRFEVTSKEYLENLIDMIAEGESLVTYYLQTPLHCTLLMNAPENEEIIVLGEGADTLFGQSTHHILHNLMGTTGSGSTNEHLRVWAFRLSKNPFLRRILQILLKLAGREASELVLATARTDESLDDPNHFLWQNGILTDREWVANKFQISLKEIISERKKGLETFSDNSLYDLVSMSTFQGYEGLSVLSKIGEKHGRKVFYPYLNDLMVEYAFKLPWEFKLKERKHVLRQVARKIGIPDFIITRPKKGFGTKTEYWALPGKIFEPFVTLCSNVFNEQEFRIMQSKNPKKAATFWFMINYALWKQIFIENTPPEKLKKKLNELLEHSKPPTQHA